MGELARADTPVGGAQTPALRCDALRLVASVVNVTRPQLSLAVVRAPLGARVLSIGARIDGFTLVALQPSHAQLRAVSGELCTLPVFSGATSSAQPSSKPAPKPPPTPAASAERKPGQDPALKPAVPDEELKGKAVFTRDELERGVRALGDGDYTISRDLLLRALKNPGGAAGGAHFRLVERDGRSIGMEVRAVRSGSALKAMGIQTGDVVRTVNGIDVTDPVGMLSALRAARESDTITLTVVRDGRERDMRYRVD